MKYIRMKNEILILKNSDYYVIDNTCEESYKSCNGVYYLSPKDIIKQADTIKELITIGDLIVWYNASSKRDEYFYIHNEDELFAVKHYPIKQIFIKVNNDFRLVVEKNDRGVLELL